MISHAILASLAYIFYLATRKVIKGENHFLAFYIIVVLRSAGLMFRIDQQPNTRCTRKSPPSFQRPMAFGYIEREQPREPLFRYFTRTLLFFFARFLQLLKRERIRETIFILLRHCILVYRKEINANYRRR